jgi:hypothetical protein
MELLIYYDTPTNICSQLKKKKGVTESAHSSPGFYLKQTALK